MIIGAIALCDTQRISVPFRKKSSYRFTALEGPRLPDIQGDRDGDRDRDGGRSCDRSRGNRSQRSPGRWVVGV